MIRKMALGLGCMSLLVSTSFAATTTHVLQLGSGIEYVLPVNEPQILSNPFVWVVKASCTILSDDDNNVIAFKVLRKSGTFNGTKLSVGNSMQLQLHANDKINVTAVPGAEVELVNIGEKAIKADCTIS